MPTLVMKICWLLCLLTHQVQRCTLLSIKTGGCPENCSYCSQSSHWSEDTGLKAEKLMDLEPVYEVRDTCVGSPGAVQALLRCRTLAA